MLAPLLGDESQSIRCSDKSLNRTRTFIRTQTWALIALAILVLAIGLISSPAMASSDSYPIARYIDSIVKPKPEPTWDAIIAPKVAKVQADKVAAEAARVAEEARLLAQQEAALQAAQIKPSQPVTVAGNDRFAALRNCESGGNYATNTGNGFYGAYQYDIGTWGNYGGYARADLAPPAVQDAKAHETQSARGWSPWPSCSRKLGLLTEARSELTGSIGYAQAGGNCVNEPGVNNPGWGNPSDWPITGYEPWIGATALFAYNHVAVVTGIWSNGDIEVRHQNFSGGEHRFPRGSFRGFR